jgi:2-polyprenyl-3-methyl-5-hydroxy-6-metoxy-1,4-benzoquinol methylase
LVHVLPTGVAPLGNPSNRADRPLSYGPGFARVHEKSSMNTSNHEHIATRFTGTENLEVMRDAVNYNRYLLRLIQVHAGDAKTAIDFGAGSGTFAIPAAEAGLDITAVELDDDLRARLARHGLRVAASTAELADASFHYAYTFNVLEHIVDDVEALRQLRRKLAPGARLLVYVPAFQLLYTSMDANVGHVRRYSRDTLVRNVAAAGFAVEKVEYADSIGFVATLAFKAFDRGSGNINRRMLRLYDRLIFPVSRAVDRATHRWIGKNLVLVARNP